jgi:hypothetical protein
MVPAVSKESWNGGSGVGMGAAVARRGPDGDNV